MSDWDAQVRAVPTGAAVSTIRLLRPKQPWSASPATMLPVGLLFRLFHFSPRFTVLLDDQPVGHIGIDDVRVFELEPGKHRLRIRFVALRRSREMRMSLNDGEERQFVCGANAFGWPTLREASPEDVAEAGRTSVSEPPVGANPTS
jgi:hypothetical protein